MRSMGATAVCETGTDKGFKSERCGLVFSLWHSGRNRVVTFNDLEITFWFLSFPLTMVQSKTGPHGSWLYNYYPS